MFPAAVALHNCEVRWHTLLPSLALRIRAQHSSELLRRYANGFSSCGCLSGRLADACRVPVECLSCVTVRACRLAFAVAAASQRRSPRRPVADFTPAGTVLSPWGLARSASLPARSLLACRLVQCRPFQLRSDAAQGRAALPASNFAGALCNPEVACCRSRRSRRRLRRVAPLPS